MLNWKCSKDPHPMEIVLPWPKHDYFKTNRNRWSGFSAIWQVAQTIIAILNFYTNMHQADNVADGKQMAILFSFNPRMFLIRLLFRFVMMKYKLRLPNSGYVRSMEKGRDDFVCLPTSFPSVMLRWMTTISCCGRLYNVVSREGKNTVACAALMILTK